MAFTSITDSVDLLVTLNKEQREAVESDSKRIVCAAGAGTGKTHTLLARLQRLVRDKDVDPDSILVLTFTRAAANEFQTRWLATSPDLGLPHFGTFHAFCYSLVCSDVAIREQLGYKEPPEALSEFEERRFWEQAEVISGISLPKRCRSVIYEPTRKEQFQHKVLIKSFRKLLTSKNKITFDIMCYDVAELFVSHHRVVEPYVDQYKYIFVDEFQDTDPMQSKFLDSFEDASLFVVGDVSQSIYSFRGADPTVMRSYLSDAAWKYYPLSFNYRSTKEICEYANTVADPEFPLKLTSERSGDAVMRLHSSELFGNLSDWKASLNGSAAIIARTNKEVDSIRDALNQAGIEHTSSRTKSAKLGDYIAALNDVNLKDHLLAWLDQSTRYRILRDAYIAGTGLQLSELILAAPDEYKRISNIRQTKEFKQFKAQYLIGEVADISEPDSGIYVGTVHSVKGLEFDDVFVFGTLPNQGISAFDNDEERNIHYVAVTRAKNRLILVQP